MPEYSDPPEGPPQESPETEMSHPTEQRKLSPISIALSCLLILASITVSQMSSTASRTEQKRLNEHGPVPGFTIQLTGRYTVGMKSILGSALVADPTLSELKATIEASDNPRIHLFFLPILMELSGNEDNLREVERMAESPGRDPVAVEASAFLKLYRQGSESLSREETRIIENYGWIGKLALSYGKPDSDPARSQVLQSAIKTFIAAIAFMAIVLAALAAGLVLFIIAIVQRRKGRLRSKLVMPVSPGDSLLEAFALFLAGLIALPALAQSLLPGLEAAAAFFTFPIILLALFWPGIRGSKGKDVRKAIGWHRGEGVMREMGAGIVGYIAGLPLLGFALIPVLLLSRSAGSVPSHPIVNEINNDPVSLTVILALACVWAPVAEETFFRGALFGFLRRRWHWSAAGIVSAFIFAIMHPQGWIAVPLLGTIGFTLSAIREWRGSIIASMTAHALNNGVVLLLTILMLT
jgi:membrane protease YdiL (CAAX protease family)